MNKSTANFSVQTSRNEAVVQAEGSVPLQSHYFSPVFNLSLEIGNFASWSCPPSSARSAHTISATLPSLLSRFLLSCGSQRASCASQTPNLRREEANTDSYSQHFIQEKRNGSSVGMRLSTPSMEPTMFPREEI